MSIRNLVNWWNGYFHSPIPVRTAAFLRIVYGLILLVDNLWRFSLRDAYYSAEGYYPLASAVAEKKSVVAEIFTWFPEWDLWFPYLSWVQFAAILAMIVGWYSRMAVVVASVLLVCFQARCPEILNGGDVIMRLIMIYMMFCPGGEVWSLDARKRGHEERPPQPIWSLRLIQLQACLIFLSATHEKLRGAHWVHGEAMYYLPHLDKYFGRLPFDLPFFDNPWFYKPITWSVVLIEGLVPILIWFKETRRWAIGAALMLHIGIELTMNLMLFQWVMIALWCSFLVDEDWDAIGKRFGGEPPRAE